MGATSTEVVSWAQGRRCPCASAPYRSSLHWEIRRPVWDWMDMGSDDCPLCMLVIIGLDVLMTENGYPRGSKERARFRKFDILLRVPAEGIGHISVSYFPDGDDIDDAIYGQWHPDSWELRLRDQASDWPWSYFSVVEQDARTMQKYADQVLEWLETCIGTHKAARCTLPTGRLPKFVPTRLLEISDDDYRQVRLIETNNELKTYIAISYCWGQASIQTVMKENYATILKHGLPWKMLPEIHQDAVQLTYRMGIRHIWIDAMCIMQQDKTDWEIESNKMVEVYENAILVLSTAHASSVDCPLLPSPREPVIMKNPLHERNGGPEDVLAFHPMDHEPLTWQPPRCKNTWPTFVRAWTLQERLLANRVVHFAPHEMIWECSCSQTCECLGVTKKDSLKHVFNGIETCPADSPEQRLWEVCFLWRFLVMQASGRKLTKPSDRLIANAGLARRLHTTMPSLGRYLAGVWEADIVHGLSWIVNTDDDAMRHATVAPSWSWASIEGEVFNEMLVNENPCRHYAALISTMCEPQAKHPDPKAFAGVISWHITLSVPVLEVIFDDGQPTPISMGNINCRVDYKFDCPGNGKTYEAIKGDVLTIAFLWGCNFFNIKRAVCSLLRPVAWSTRIPGGCLQFRRIGVALLYPEDNTGDNIEHVLKEVGMLGKKIVEVI